MKKNNLIESRAYIIIGSLILATILISNFITISQKESINSYVTANIHTPLLGILIFYNIYVLFFYITIGILFILIGIRKYSRLKDYKNNFKRK
jgi:hypothetical protein